MTPFSHQDLMIAVLPEDAEVQETWDCRGSECPPNKPCTNKPTQTGTDVGIDQDPFGSQAFEALQAELDRKISS